MSSLKKQFSVERRPRMLKDFLKDIDSISCSSSGFKSFPRRLIFHDYHDLYVANNKASPSPSPSSSILLRSRSKAAVSTTISAFQAMVNTVKSFQFNIVKSPSILRRNLSRKLSKKNSNKEINNDHHIKITIRVKDILRWKSFRDLVDEKPQPPDHHHQCTTTTTTTGSTNSTPCSTSNGSSWCESDFTSEYLPSWSGNLNDVEVGENYLPCVGVGSGWMKATVESVVDPVVGPKELQCEEKEQCSPVSVLDFQLDEDSASSSDRTPANLEKWMSVEVSDDEDDFAEEEEEEDEAVNEVEEKAKLLLLLLMNHVKATSPLIMWSCKDQSFALMEKLLYDFFVDELRSLNQSKSNEIDHHGDMIKQAEAWIKGEHNATLLTDHQGDDACVRDMDRRESWNKFEGHEQEEVALQIENTLLNLLLDDLLLDLF